VRFPQDQACYLSGTEPGLAAHCPWLDPTLNHWDWGFIITPSLLVLVCNSVFLARIMWVLITKLRSTNSAAIQQYKKATKALMVLVPLLGLTYILVLDHGATDHVVGYLQAILISTQGLIVSTIYCFCNSEVQDAVRKRYLRWRPKQSSLSELNNSSVKLRDPKRSATSTELTYMVGPNGAESDAV